MREKVSMVGCGSKRKGKEKEKNKKLWKSENERLKDHTQPEYAIKNKKGEIRVE